MARDALNVAEKLMRRRDFSSAIKLLEGRREIYEGNFDYYLLLANACLYVGDAGTASTYYARAREIRLTDTNLLLGQAALFLRRGDTERAIQYYLDVLENDPQNKTAKDALEFIRTKGDYNTICRWIDDGRIEKFYPPISAGSMPWSVIIPSIACVLGVAVVLFIVRSRQSVVSGTRADLSALMLSADETKNAHESNVSPNTYIFMLSNTEITESYANAQRYFHSYRDNAAQIEINRILNSNAVPSIKQKARLLMDYLAAPTFDTITDNPSYSDVARNVALYMDCFAVWSGRVANAQMRGTSYRCDFLVGYETQEKIEGIVPLSFASNPGITSAQPVRVLGKITMENGRLCLEGHAAYQSVHDFLEEP